MPVGKRSWWLTLFWRLHRWLYDVSDGRLGSRMFGNQILKLTATGRRSGQPKEVLLSYFPYGDSQVIIASNVGSDRHPAWFLNLEANPEAQVQLGTERRPVRARVMEGEERARLWAEITAKDRSYVAYQERTERAIPLVAVDPIEAAA